MDRFNTEAIQPLAPLSKKDLVGRQVYRGYTKAGRQIYGVKFEDIEFREGFDKRIQLGDLDELGDSIFGSGLHEPLVLDALSNGKFLLVDGHRRFRAIKLKKEKGFPGFDYIEAHILNTKTTDYDRYAIMVAKNQMGKDMEPLELGNVFAEMVKDIDPVTQKTKTASDIARSTGYSKMHVSNMLRLAGVDAEIKEAVLEGKLSPTAALEMDKAGMSIEEQINAINQANEEGHKPKVEDIRNGTISAVDNWDKSMGEEIKVVSESQLLPFVGRKFAQRVIKQWKEDFIDEDTGQVISIDRKEILYEKGWIFEEDMIIDILEANIKLLRFEFHFQDNTNEPTDPDDAMSADKNAEADQQEIQDAGLFGVNKDKSSNLLDLSVESIMLLKGLHHRHITPTFTDADYQEQHDKLMQHLNDIKKMAEHLIKS